MVISWLGLARCKTLAFCLQENVPTNNLQQEQTLHHLIRTFSEDFIFKRILITSIKITKCYNCAYKLVSRSLLIVHCPLLSSWKYYSLKLSDESETSIDDTKVNVTLSEANKQVQLASQDIDLTMWSILSVDAYNLRLRWMPKLAFGSTLGQGSYKSARKCARLTLATCSSFWCKAY